METEYYTVAEVAKRTGFDKRTVQMWANAKKVPGQIKIGRNWRFKKFEIEEALSRESFLNEELPV